MLTALLLCLGYEEERSLLMSQKSLEKQFGQSPVFNASTFMEQGGITRVNKSSNVAERIHPCDQLWL
ncbi:hypothetical protein AAC387_Pa04g0018 [Persea americana]